MIATTKQPALSSPLAFEIQQHPLVVKARDEVQRSFEGVMRKVPIGWEYPTKPYYEHLHAVANTLIVHGFGAEEVAAGYLHDNLEDLPETWSISRIAQEFTPRVAELVNWVTQQDKSLSWEMRNELYEARLALAPDQAKAISCADKISNLSDTIPFLRLGYPVGDLLKRGWSANSEKLHKLLGIFEGHVPDAMFIQFYALLSTFDQLGRPLDTNVNTQGFHHQALSPPAVGSQIYVPNSFYLSHGVDDFAGGIAKVSEVVHEKHAGEMVDFVSIVERPGRLYNWKFLASEQNRLKELFDQRRARPDPDYHPSANSDWS